MKSLSVRAGRIAVCLALALVAGAVSIASAQTNYYSQNGTEYPVTDVGPGDQMFPDVAITPTNGIVVCQDNTIDPAGLGIRAQRLDSTLSATLSSFRVNNSTNGNQQNPRVGMLKKGGAAVVWQGGPAGFQHIYARFLTASNTFLTATDILVSTSTTHYQVNPAMAVLTNGNVAVVWASYYQVNSNSMQDVYCQILSTNGTHIGTNFLVNQFTPYNQRTPTVAALQNGGFVVGWVSEQENVSIPESYGSNNVAATSGTLLTPSVDVYARLYNANGIATTPEFKVNTDANTCANPAVAGASDGSFMVVWGEFDSLDVTNSWDVYARSFTSAAVGGAVSVVNTHTYGDQYAPRISCIGIDYLVTWTSLGQDGSREGVYGQYLHEGGAPVGGEFRANTTTVGPQMQGVVASDGVSQFLAVWTSFVGLPNGFDLYGQRFINVASILDAMSAPYVWAPFVSVSNIYQPELVVSWAPVLGLSVTNYEVYVNGSGTPSGVVTGNSWTMTAADGLAASTTDYFQVDYVTTDGRRSPLSPAASGTTWEGPDWGGIPDEWMIAYYGNDGTLWPLPTAKLSPSMTVYQVFLSGGNPLDPSTWLQTQVVKTAQGIFVEWNTQAGATYQVQVSSNLTGVWQNLGAPRFAAGASDSINVGSGSKGYYRIQLLR